MNIYMAGFFAGVAATLYIEMVIALALGWWATREEADGEEVEEWPEPKSIHFTVTNDSNG